MVLVVLLSGSWFKPATDVTGNIQQVVARLELKVQALAQLSKLVLTKVNRSH